MSTPTLARTPAPLRTRPVVLPDRARDLLWTATAHGWTIDRVEAADALGPLIVTVDLTRADSPAFKVTWHARPGGRVQLHSKLMREVERPDRWIDAPSLNRIRAMVAAPSSAGGQPAQCPECGQPYPAYVDEYGRRVLRHDIGENIGRTTGVICPGGRVRT
jgi:hypothetical protein